MSDMIERVARAMASEMDKPVPPEDEDPFMGNRLSRYRSAARAAIEAMREPTAEMAVAGAKTMAAAMPDGEAQTAVIYGQPKDVFNAMIAEALE